MVRIYWDMSSKLQISHFQVRTTLGSWMMWWLRKRDKCCKCIKKYLGLAPIQLKKSRSLKNSLQMARREEERETWKSMLHLSLKSAMWSIRMFKRLKIHSSYRMKCCRRKCFQIYLNLITMALMCLWCAMDFKVLHSIWETSKTSYQLHFQTLCSCAHQQMNKTQKVVSSIWVINWRKRFTNS